MLAKELKKALQSFTIEVSDKLGELTIIVEKKRFSFYCKNFKRKQRTQFQSTNRFNSGRLFIPRKRI